MRIPDHWRETKFVVDPHSGALRGSKDPAELSTASRLVTDRIAGFYTRVIRDHAHGHLLDLGCGKAPLLGFYARFVERVTLVDWGNSIHKNSLLDIVTDLNERLPLDDEFYDTVILSDVLEHIAEPQGLLNEVCRLLKGNGGVLLLNVPFFYPIHEEPFDFYRYTRFSLDKMCKIAGLRVLEISPMGGLPEVIVDITSKIFLHLPIIGTRFAALLQSVGGWLLKHWPSTYASSRSADRFPLGYTLVAIKDSHRG